jgi:hypothetical protein
MKRRCALIMLSTALLCNSAMAADNLVTLPISEALVKI